ncbi:class I SAM-dependent methyltransferase [Salinimonas lutimaris]|uniref:class I SAM-dependent methyltransferase n=1 Tax=Salinimonas lutimaris TaxID=914153 RepID=UPI0010C03C0D|nr:class I SAM-dependent methyltransferase [Salinimonas lutimaris]
MKPAELGLKYDKIAQWWHNRHTSSSYGINQVKKAMSYGQHGGHALDVGCGAGGRFIRLLQSSGYTVTGLDVSQEMIRLADIHHPQHTFLHQDISTWQSKQQFDFILAWDSIFHLPLAMQTPVVTNLCQRLASQGVLIYTLGDAVGEHTDQWHNDTFYYSSVGINQNLRILMDNGLSVKHLELDQYPDNHVYIIATKD